MYGPGAMPTEMAVEMSREFTAPRALVWALVSDTNRWDRVTGLKPPRYTWVVEQGRRVRRAEAREMGFDIAWLEPPYRWVEGRMIEAERRFVKGPAQAGGFTVWLEDHSVPGEKVVRTRVRARAWVRAPWLIAAVQRVKFARALPRYLDAIGALLRDTPMDERAAGDEAEPAAVRARRLARGYANEIVTGTRTPTDSPVLRARLDALSQNPEAAGWTNRFEHLLNELADDDVAALRPFELARHWQTSRRETLYACLLATEAGLLDLRWQIICPTCRVPAAHVAALADLKNSSHCEACDIGYGIDFARHVEAVFAPNAAVRRVSPATYCASSPAFLPHVLAQVQVAAASRGEWPIELPAGSLHLRTLYSRLVADLELDQTNRDVVVTLTAAGLRVNAVPCAQAQSRLIVENETNEPVVLLLERSGWSADIASGIVVAAFPGFMRLFATDAPAAGVELAVGEVALVFTDLTGSTALYERIGDAKAFALVEEHFRVMTQVVEAAGGSVVKTMGDAVMAGFPSLRDAVGASVGMVRAHDLAFPDGDLTVKIGVHAGPCLIVRANDRLDYFGTTVNVAARLQAQASPGEVVFSETMLRWPGVPEHVRGLEQRTFMANLKGIAGEQSLIAVKP